MLSNFLRFLAVLFLLAAEGWSSLANSGVGKTNVIKYRKPGHIYQKQISEEGDSLIIGLEPKESYGTYQTKLSCAKHNGNDYYKDEYNIKVSTRERNYLKIKDEKNVDLSNYFVPITKEVWSCYEGGDTKNGVMMIVNELVGIKEIFEVKYYDGIEVSTEFLPHGVRTARVRETKFIKADKPLQALRFAGTFVYQDEGKFHYNIPGFAKTNREILVEKFENNIIKEVKFELSDSSSEHSAKISDKGKILKIGSPWTKVFGNNSFVSACFPQQGLYPFPQEFRTTVYDLLKTSDATPDQKISALLTDKFFMKYFIPIRTEVWTCTPMEGKDFLRIVNEVVGIIEIQEVKFYDGITHIYTINKAPGGPKTVRFREVKFLNPVTKEVLKYEGALRLVESSSKTSFGDNIVFNLDANRLYRTLINSKGYDLTVGSRWEREIGTSEDTITCVDKGVNSEKFHKEYSTKFRIKTEMKNGVIATHRLEYITKSKMFEYFEFINGQVLACEGVIKGSNGVKMSFLRIFNEIEVLLPVHEIEFYDGVEIFETFTDPNTKSVRIREIKYLSDDDKLDVLKYEGSMELPSSHVHQEFTGWQAVEVKKDDIFWSVGHLSGKKHELRERIYTLAENEYHSITIGRQPNVLIIGDYAKSALGNNTDVVVCGRSESLSKTDGQSMFRKASVKRINRKGAELEIFAHLLPEYFIYTKEELWDCEHVDENINLTFQRFVNRFYLRKKPPFSFGKLNFVDSEKAWVEVGDNRNGIQVEVEEILYKEGLTATADYQKYEGYTILDDGNESKGVRISGTMEFEDDKEKFNRILDYLAEDIEYHADREIKYHETFLNSKGVSLLIGSKWQRTFGDGNMIMNCEQASFHEGLFDTYFRTRVKKLGEDINNQLLFQSYFDDLKTEIWICTEKNKRKSGGFFRILTQFSIKPSHCDKIAKVWHYDGVTVLMGNYMYGSTGCMEFAEVKYLDAEDYVPLKFEGTLQLLKGKNPVSKKITSVHLTDVAKVEVYNQPELHMKNKVFKTVVKDEGLTIEVGSPHDDVIRKKKVDCTEWFGPDAENKKKRFRPKIVINRIFRKYKPATENHVITTGPQNMDKQTFDGCFETHISEIWKCVEKTEEPEKQEQPKKQERPEEESLVFYRLVNKLVARESCPIARVYYHTGVTVDVKPSVTIREIKYINALNGKVSRYEGFVNIIELLQKAHEYEDAFGKDSREIFYVLDTTSLFLTKVEIPYTGVLEKRYGVILEVGSQWEEEFGTADDSVLCQRKMNHTFDKSYNTKIFSNVKGLIDVNSKVEMNTETFPKYFEVLRQEVYTCQKNEDEKFLRVVNLNVALVDISQIYHPDGITVETQVFPDETKSKIIREVKYLHPETKKVLRYNGEMTLESIISNGNTKLLQMPNEFQSLDVEKKSADEVKYWTVDVLRVHALRLIQKIKPNELNPAEKIEYTFKNLHVTRIAEGYDVKMKVGSQWEEEFVTKGNEMTCMLDQWNPTDKSQFLTKVQLYFDNEKYELNYDRINDNFIIKKIEVWICVNQDDTMLRVVTTMEGTSGIFVVLHRDGVKVEPFTLPDGGSSARIIETKFMHPKNFKILKYTGKLQLITPTQIASKKTEIAAPEWRSGLTKDRLYWVKNLIGWSKPR